MGAHAKQRRSILFLLYRALVREAQALTGLIAYHGEAGCPDGGAVAAGGRCLNRPWIGICAGKGMI
jgi:hypothetical protein